VRDALSSARDGTDDDVSGSGSGSRSSRSSGSGERSSSGSRSESSSDVGERAALEGIAAAADVLMRRARIKVLLAELVDLLVN